MNDWLKQVKESWNETADSEWYQSLRTDKIVAKLVEKPTSVFHKSVYNLINIYPICTIKRFYCPQAEIITQLLPLLC